MRYALYLGCTAPVRAMNVVFYPQLLGLAMGLSADEMGLPLNRVKSRKLMEIAKAR
jgi:heterodisulfide reductase subunit B